MNKKHVVDAMVYMRITEPEKNPSHIFGDPTGNMLPHVNTDHLFEQGRVGDTGIMRSTHNVHIISRHHITLPIFELEMF